MKSEIKKSKIIQVKQVPCMRVAPKNINTKRPKIENEIVQNGKQRNFCSKLCRKREENITNCLI